MTPKTATEISEKSAYKEYTESRLHRMHVAFRVRWSPEDRRSASEFEADLAILLREIQMDTLKPFQDAAASALAMRPVSPVFITQKEGFRD